MNCRCGDYNAKKPASFGRYGTAEWVVPLIEGVTTIAGAGISAIGAGQAAQQQRIQQEAALRLERRRLAEQRAEDARRAAEIRMIQQAGMVQTPQIPPPSGGVPSAGVTGPMILFAGGVAAVLLYVAMVPRSSGMGRRVMA